MKGTSSFQGMLLTGQKIPDGSYKKAAPPKVEKSGILSRRELGSAFRK